MAPTDIVVPVAPVIVLDTVRIRAATSGHTATLIAGTAVLQATGVDRGVTAVIRRITDAFPMVAGSREDLLLSACHLIEVQP